VGASLPTEIADAAVRALVESVRGDNRALRLHLELFSRDAQERDQLGGIARTYGFTRLPEVTNYEYTLATDLAGTDDAGHLASLSQGVRQNIRALAKYPVELRPIRDESDSQRMNALMRDTLARTGARHHERDYGSTIRLAIAEPAVARLVGLYRTDGIGGEDALIAFALGLNNVDHVAYDIGASGRVPEFKNVSLGYPLLWDLISWARSVGAAWFDYGGVPAANSEGEERLRSISDFKRRFEKNAVRVSEEWALTPHPMRAAAARVVSRAVQALRRPGG
jgi:lipid II:glycine glycyltransferase (peptidoglycan interpeptide bridge formation enzyme)